MACSKLEEIGNATRSEILNKNIYVEQQFVYGVQNRNATQALGGQDDLLNNKGKGTGIFLDTGNGGSHVDIYGIPSLGGGRNQIYSNNQYTPDKVYDCFAF